MRRTAAALALLALLAPHGSAAEAQRAEREMVLTFPRPIGAGETAFIEMQLGAVRAGETIEIATAVVCPRRHFAVRRARRTGCRNLYGTDPGGCDPRGTHRDPPDDQARRCDARADDANRRGMKLSIVGSGR